MLGRRWRRRTRWFFRVLIFLPLAGVLAVLLLMRSPLVGSVVTRQLEAALGCEASAGSSYIMFDGRVVLRDLSLRVPGLANPHAEFLRVERAEIDADWSRVFSAGVKPTGIRLYGPRFRVSSTTEGQALNIQGLHPTDPDAMSSDKPIRIDVHTGMLELGENSAQGYTVLREIGISGEVVPSETEPGLYRIRFRELPAPAIFPSPIAGAGMVLNGRVDLRSSIAVMELLNFDLTSWGPPTVPTLMRSVWEQLNIKGRINSTALEYFPTTGLRAVVQLDDVSMDAIVPANFPTGEPTQDVLSLRKVHGTITLSGAGLDADVAGLLENQQHQSRVILKTRDLSTDAALECKIISRGFRLDKAPSLLTFAPPVVAERLANFSGPTAVLDADVVIRRDPPTPAGASPFRVAGWLTFEHGAAAFDKVPYPFTDMSGRVEFDDDGIDIIRITGVGPDGARLAARGRIAPPNDDAAVDVEVRVRGAPLDKTFMDSLPAGRREAIDFLFSADRYAELRQAGLVAAPGADAAPTGGGPPPFALGGQMDLDIVVHSPQGKDAPWNYTVDVIIPRAGLLTRAFPLPVDARDVRLRLTEKDARLVAGSFHGLRGGQTEIAAQVVLEADDGSSVIRPSVTIDSSGIPIDDLLIHAIEHVSGDGPRGDGSAFPSPAEMLRVLRLRGDVDCLAKISSSPHESIDFDIGVSFEKLSASPVRAGAEPLVLLESIAGSLRLTNTSVTAPSLTAAVVGGPGIQEMIPDIAAGADLGWIGLQLSAGLRGIDTSLAPRAEGQPPSRASVVDLRATLDLHGVEVAAPLEESLAAFSPRIADQVAEFRNSRQPAGRISAGVTVEQAGGDQALRAVARLTAAENLVFTAADERLVTSLHSGAVVFDSKDESMVSFEQTALEIGVGDLARAPVLLDGSLFLDGAGAAESAAGAALSITGRDIPVESPAVALVLRHVLEPEDIRTIMDANPSGRFDANVSIPAGALVSESKDAFEGVTASLEPRTLRFDFEGSRVVIESFEGRVAIQPRSISIEQLVARADDWTVALDGRWAPDEAGAGALLATASIEAHALTPGIRAILPAGLREELDRIELRIEGPLAVRDAQIEYRPQRAGAPTAAGGSSVRGTIDFSGASLDVGAPLADARGSLLLTASRTPERPRWSFGLDLNADRLVAAGLEMSDLRARLVVGEEPGEVSLEHLDADCYAGRVTAIARVTTPPDGAGAAGAPGVAAYEAEITMAGVCFAPVLAALDAARERTPGIEPEPLPTELSSDPSRGRLDGTLAITGLAGDAASRSGSGSVRIAGGDVVAMPLVLTLIQLSNFQLPSSDRLDFLQTLFHISGETIAFDQIDLLSSSVTIAGRGVMTWPAQELDLRFNSRAGQRVPLVSDVFETLRDEIATTRIRGTLSAPQVGPEPLTGTRQLIGTIVGERSTPRAVGLPDSRAERERHRAREVHTPAR